MNIREYQPEDREAIEKCVFELQDAENKRLPHYWMSAEEATHPYYDYLVKKIIAERGQIFVAEKSERVIGFIAVVTDKNDSPCVAIKKYAYIPDFAVLKEFQKMGVGKQLMDKAEQFARESGMKYIMLDVTYTNPAFDFYKKYGYREQGITMDKKII